MEETVRYELVRLLKHLNTLIEIGIKLVKQELDARPPTRRP